MRKFCVGGFTHQIATPHTYFIVTYSCCSGSFCLFAYHKSNSNTRTHRAYTDINSHLEWYSILCQTERWSMVPKWRKRWGCDRERAELNWTELEMNYNEIIRCHFACLNAFQTHLISCVARPRTWLKGRVTAKPYTQHTYKAKHTKPKQRTTHIY